MNCVILITQCLYLWLNVHKTSFYGVSTSEPAADLENVPVIIIEGTKNGSSENSTKEEAFSGLDECTHRGTGHPVNFV